MDSKKGPAGRVAVMIALVNVALKAGMLLIPHLQMFAGVSGTRQSVIFT
jgi:hypothetical protein